MIKVTQDQWLVVTKFIQDQWLRAIFYTSVLFIGIWDSTITLAVYLVAIHILTIIAFLNLSTKKHLISLNIKTYKQALYSLAEVTVFLTVLGIRNHWYTFYITVSCLFLLNVTTTLRYRK